MHDLANPSVTDWMTAAATAATVVVAFVVGLSACLRDRASKWPVVEADFIRQDYPRLGAVVQVAVEITNCLSGRLMLTDARLKLPVGGRILRDRGYVGSRLLADALPGPGGIIAELGPAGSVPDGPMDRGDNGLVRFLVVPPADWPGGWVRISFMCRSKSRLVRDRRIVVSRQIMVETMIPTALRASSKG